MASLMVAALPMASQTLNSGYKSLSFSRSETLIPLLISSSSVSVSLPTTSPTLPSIYCGRGDRKTAKGKRFNHSFGNARPRNKNKGRGPPRIPVPAVAPKTDVFEDDEVVKIEIDESLEEEE